MPVIRVDAVGDDLNSALPLAEMRRSPGPIVVMIHGYKYHPDHPAHCPHRSLFSTEPQTEAAWPRRLGFATGTKDEGIAIALGWPARGALWKAQRRARRTGQTLAGLVSHLGRPVHVIAHSLGLDVALEALHHLPAGSIDRLISLTGAAYTSRATAALDTPAGRACAFFNITSRENDTFDFLFERLIAPPLPNERAIGHGLQAPNALTLQLDCRATLAHLARLGAVIDPTRRRICHWSSYTRPGALEFYRDLIRDPDRMTMAALRAGVPPTPSPRWSGLFKVPPPLLPFAQKPS